MIKRNEVVGSAQTQMNVELIADKFLREVERGQLRDHQESRQKCHDHPHPPFTNQHIQQKKNQHENRQVNEFDRSTEEMPGIFEGLQHEING